MRTDLITHKSILLIVAAAALLCSDFAAAQLYESGGYRTSRRPASWLDLSLLMGEGEDWLDHPTFDLSFNTQFQLDYTALVNGPDSFNLVNTSDLSMDLKFAPRLAIFTDIVLDQVNGPDPGDNSWLEGEGLWVDDVFLQWSDQTFTLGGGIFTPNFGIANALAPGVYGGDFVGDYSFDDQVGFFGSIDLGREQIGRHIISSSLFMQDTSFFSNSLITHRGPVKLSDGGPGNTNSLESFTVTYDGIDVPIFDLPILQYQIGMISQAAGQGDTGRQLGVVGGIAVTIPLDRDPLATASNRYQALQPLIEITHFENWQGVDDSTADFYTFGASYWLGDWNFSASGTMRDVSVPSAADQDDFLIQASIGYQLYGYQALEGNGQVAFGWSYQEIGGVDQHVFGVVLSLGWDTFQNLQVFRGW
jgi:hypothetical protein